MKIEFCNAIKMSDDQLLQIENKFGQSLPPYVSDFYKNYSNSYPRINGKSCNIKITHPGGWIQENFIESIDSYEMLEMHLAYSDYLKEYAVHFELGEQFVETQFLFPIANLPNGVVYIAVRGRHCNKVYTADNGDFGILFHSNTFEEFWKSAYES